jgi:hypothetical protein
MCDQIVISIHPPPGHISMEKPGVLFVGRRELDSLNAPPEHGHGLELL